MREGVEIDQVTWEHIKELAQKLGIGTLPECL